jgi:hypothetical protein
VCVCIGVRIVISGLGKVLSLLYSAWAFGGVGGFIVLFCSIPVGAKRRLIGLGCGCHFDIRDVDSVDIV